MIPDGHLLRRWVGRSTGVCVVAAALIVLMLLGSVVHDQTMIHRKLGALRGQGFPVTIEQLEMWEPDGPTDRQGAYWYHRAFMVIAQRPVPPPHPIMPNDVTALGVSRPMPQSMRQIIAAQLAQEAQVLGFLHDAAHCEPTGFRAKIGNFGALRVRYHDQALRAAWLLALEALLAAERGDAQSAGEALLAIPPLAHALKNDATMEAYFTRYRVLATLCDALGRVSTLVDIDTATRAALRRRLNEADSRDHLARMLVGERVRSIVMLTTDSRRFDAGGLPSALSIGRSEINDELDAFAALLHATSHASDEQLTARFNALHARFITQDVTAYTHLRLRQRLRVARRVLMGERFADRSPPR